MTDQPYPPFSGDDVTCPKCGAGSVGAAYQPPDTRYVRHSEFMGYASGAPEWMRRECIDCGYSWPEMCVDADPEGKPMPTGDDFIERFHDEDLIDPNNLSAKDKGLVQRLIGKRDWP